jgi:hypothetical protein
MSVYHKAPAISTPAQTLRAADAPGVVFTLAGAVLQRRLTSDRQILRNPPAHCVPVGILQQAERRGATHVVITAADGTRYGCRLAQFWEAPAFELNRGYGRQRALPLSKWVVKPAQQPALLEVAE